MREIFLLYGSLGSPCRWFTEQSKCYARLKEMAVLGNLRFIEF
jgi:hypothetical protein